MVLARKYILPRSASVAASLPAVLLVAVFALLASVHASMPANEIAVIQELCDVLTATGTKPPGWHCADPRCASC